MSSKKNHTSTYHHETDPIVTDVRTGTETRPHTINAQGMTTCQCNGNQGVCSCAPNTCACSGCAMKSSRNPTASHGPKPGMGVRIRDEGSGEGSKMGMGTHGCRRQGKGDCGCPEGTCEYASSDGKSGGSGSGKKQR